MKLCINCLKFILCSEGEMNFRIVYTSSYSDVQHLRLKFATKCIKFFSVKFNRLFWDICIYTCRCLYEHFSWNELDRLLKALYLSKLHLFCSCFSLQFFVFIVFSIFFLTFVCFLLFVSIYFCFCLFLFFIVFVFFVFSFIDILLRVS